MSDDEPLPPACAACEEPGYCFPGPCKRYQARRTSVRPPERHWSVTVRLNGGEVVTIETAHLAGIEIGQDQEWAIRMAALNLLAFIGQAPDCTYTAWKDVSA
jgi:hypothetical protein